MPNFFARIEIHGAEQPKYDELYLLLKGEGYTDTPGRLGYTCKLPTGTYVKQAGLLGSTVIATPEELSAEAEKLSQLIIKARISDRAPGIVVTPFTTLETRGLQCPGADYVLGLHTYSKPQ